MKTDDIERRKKRRERKREEKKNNHIIICIGKNHFIYIKGKLYVKLVCVNMYVCEMDARMPLLVVKLGVFQVHTRI